MVSEEAAGDRTRNSGPLLPGRSPRRHQGVHQQAHRLHRQYRPDRERTPRFGLVYAPARALLALTLARWRGRGGKSSMRASMARTWPSSIAALSARAPGPEGSRGSRQPLPSRPGHGTILVEAQNRQAIERGLLARSSSCVARGEGGRLSAVRPHHGMGYRRGPCGAGSRGRRGGTAEGKPLRYGKTEAGLLNPSFIAWGPRARGVTSKAGARRASLRDRERRRPASTVDRSVPCPRRTRPAPLPQIQAHRQPRPT